MPSVEEELLRVWGGLRRPILATASFYAALVDLADDLASMPEDVADQVLASLHPVVADIAEVGHELDRANVRIRQWQETTRGIGRPAHWHHRQHFPWDQSDYPFTGRGE